VAQLRLDRHGRRVIEEATCHRTGHHAIVVALAKTGDAHLPLRKFCITSVCSHPELGQQRLKVQLIVRIHDTDTPTSSVFLLSECGLSSVLHQCLILFLFLVHGQLKLLVEASKQVLIAIELEREG